MSPLTTIPFLIAFLFAAVPAARVVAEPATRAFVDCPGCAAHKHEDPLTGMVGGVQIITQGPDLRFVGLDLAPESGSCTVTINSDGTPVCGGDKNCSFHATGKAVSPTLTPFRDDYLGPCHWSQAGTLPNPIGPPMPVQVIDIDYTWIAACSGYVTSADFRFFKNATGCLDGQIIGEVQFSGKCDGCQPL